MKKVTSVLFAMIILLSASAQTKSKSILKNWDYSFTTMTKQGLFAPALGVTQYFSLSAKKQTKFQLGFGVRLTQVSAGHCIRYITAPAKLTTGKSGLGVFFANQVATNADTVGLDNSSVTAINAMVALNYHINSKFNVEFNIDLAGLSFGGKQNAFLRRQNGVDDTLSVATATPTNYNALLTSDNDLGTLNSEVVGVYKLNNHWKLKAGLGFLFTEYTFTTPTYKNTSGTTITNDRFRNKSMGANVGIIYHF
jgi:hypothetical protein